MKPRVGVWPTLPYAAYAHVRPRPLPFPFGQPSLRLYARARVGLWHALQALLRPGDEVLMPVYNHGSEVEAVVRAGLQPRFYAGSERLEPDEDELDGLLAGGRVRALYLIHFLGFPQDAPRWRRWCDERRLALVEDAAQAWLADVDGVPAGSWGDAAVFCLYKTFGIPDGAAVVAPGTRLPEPSESRGGVTPLARRHASRELGRFDIVENAHRRVRARQSADPNAEFALGDLDAAPSAVSRLLLPRVYDADAAKTRRANYATLLAEIGDLAPEPFRTLPRGASPFTFPVETRDRDDLVERLDRALITPLVFWSEPHPAIPPDASPLAAHLRTSVVGLPVHQDVDANALDRIVDVVRPRARRRQLRLEPVDSFEDVRAEWDALAAASDNVFATYEWQETWWRHFGGGKRLQLTACLDGDRVVGILPLYVWRERPLRVLRFLGHGPGDELGPVCALEDRPRVAAAMRRALADRSWEWDVLLAEQLRGDAAWAALLGGRVLRRTGFPSLILDTTDWDEYLARRSSHFRKKLRWQQRKFERECAPVFRLTDDAARLETDMEILFDLHERRWAGHDSPFVGDRKPFHREVAAAAFARGWLRLWIVEVDGTPAAAWYGFRFAGTDGYYQAGRDRRWDEYSAGYLAVVHTIRDAVESGRREYRFLRGDEAYKYRFAVHDDGLDIVLRGRGPLGLAAVGAGAALYRSPLRSAIRGAAEA